MNFLEIENFKDKSNTWRGVVAVFLILVAIGSVIYRTNSFSSEREMLNKVLQPLQNIKIGGGGGDVIVEPPRPVKPSLPELTGTMKSAEDFTAHSIIVKDVKTGMVMYRKNEYDKWPIASITKLMSALILLEKNPDWTTSTVVVGADSLDTHVYAGDTYTLEDLWLAGLVGSSNKAILSLANALDWPEEAFVERMNQKALELGMTETYFTDPTGLDSTDVASASDVAILINEAMKQDKIKQTLLTKEISLYSEERGKSHHIWNTDWLLLGWVPHTFVDFRGGKTGYITLSDYNFTMQVGDGNVHTVNVVILGAKTHEGRFTEARDIAEWVFANYKWPDT
ncbi:MAG TPA: hypothetical protein DEB09_03540 [Candidatus Magasanikbacteria bacterium]|nr:hypothetical protein [Candidatus Magasanikbacteria bacterium]